MYEKSYTTLSPLTAFVLTSVVTCSTLLGIAMGKKMEKVPIHIEIPSRRRYSLVSKVD